MEEKKHVCKHCNKRFSCGKSLGGHIRIHMMNEHYSANDSKEERNNVAMLKRKRDLGSYGGEDGNFNYGLRENPKRTIRFVHSNSYVNKNNSDQMENFCKECGKGFTSLKALCGHMASHSEKDKGRFENNNSDSVITEKQKYVVVDSNNSGSSSQSDAETSLPMKSTRTKRIKFKNLSNSNNNSCKSHPLSNGSSSSSVSEVDNEKEEGAKCLMLLSIEKKPFTLAIDSLENDTNDLDEKSPSPSGYDSDNSDSGYFLYGPKKLDSADEVNYSKRYFEYIENVSRKRLRPNNDSLAQTLVGASHKKAKNDEHNEHGDNDSAYESDENSTDSDSYAAAKTQNNNTNICKNLNGKVKCNKKEKKKLKSKKVKEHECPICNKIFKSGQALGGHKRSHFIGGYYEENNTLVVSPDPPPSVRLASMAPPPPPAAPAPAPACLIDLNLPAPDDE